MLRVLVQFSVAAFLFFSSQIVAASVCDQEEAFLGKTTFKVGEHIEPRPLYGIGKQCEDFFCVATKSCLPFCAVFDGNGGYHAAEKASTDLHENLKEQCVVEGAFADSDERIKKAFSVTSNAIDKLGPKAGASTAVAVFFSHDQTSGADILHVAHIGDSRAILGVMEGESILPQELTKPHRPTNIKEIERHKRKMNEEFVRPRKRTKKHHNEENEGNPAREDECDTLDRKDVKQWEEHTGLAVTRCFGHAHLRKKGLIAEPEILHLPISAAHKFVVLLSDGVHDHITDADVVQFVWQELLAGKEPNDIASALIVKAARNDTRNRFHEHRDWTKVKLGIKDDMTAVIVVLEPTVP